MCGPLGLGRFPRAIWGMNSRRLDKIKRNLRARDDHTIVMSGDQIQTVRAERPTVSPQRRDYRASLEPGGSRAWIMESAATKCTKAERVAFVAELMADGLWRTQLSRVISELWEISPHAMSNITGEAGRWLSAAFGDREEVRAKCMTMLEVIAQDAMENGDRRSAVAAVRAVADLGGLVTKKTEISGPNGGPIHLQDLSRLSDAELEQAIVQAAANAIRANGGPTDDASQAILAAESKIKETE